MVNPEKNNDAGQEGFSRAQQYRSLLGEELQTRTEHSRSLEDAEKYRALETLKDLGVLIPLSELDTYHGRARHLDEVEAWEVDPTFRNGGDDSGNNNVNKRPTLYTASEATATDFAAARADIGNLRITGSPEYAAEIHRIVSQDTDAMVFNYDFNLADLSVEERGQYFAALKKLLLTVSEGSPLAFEDRQAWNQLAPHIQALGQRQYIMETDISQLSLVSGLSEPVVRQLVGAINAQQAAGSQPGYLVDRLVGSSEDLSHGRVKLEGNWQDVPLNLEYVKKYLQEAHIVGVQQPIYSATLDSNLDIVSFFDLDKVKTTETMTQERNDSRYYYGGLANAFNGLTGRETIQRSSLMARLTDVHASPQKLMQDARIVPGYEEIFRGNTGVWEGYTLGEHTETVLRNFEETYADILPVGLLAPMRLAIITHDIGKNETVARQDKAEQAQANAAQAVDFMDRLGIDSRHQALIISMITRGSDLAYLIDVKGVGGEAKQAMFSLAKNTISEFFGREPSREEMRAFVMMCRVLQRCDGGAYTSMAVTRPENGGSYYRNAPSFNNSFAEPVDMGRRKVQLRDESQAPARSQQAPKAVGSVSRIRMRPKGNAAQPPHY